MIALSKEQVLLIHKQLIDHYGGIHGIRDEGLLDSALHSPFQRFGGYDLFPSVADKAARLCIGLVQNHPFLGGNKRIGAMILLMTFDLNHIEFHTNSQELADIILRLAAKEIDAESFFQWVKNRIS